LRDSDLPQRTGEPRPFEDRRTVFLVEREDLVRRQTQAQTECDDATSRSSNNQVEELRDRLPKGFFKRRQEGRRKHALDPTAVDRKNPPHRATVSGKYASPRSRRHRAIASGRLDASRAAWATKVHFFASS